MPEAADSPNKEKKSENLPEPVEKIVQTHHTATIGGESIAYTVTTGTILLKVEDEEKGEKAKAMVFFVAYTKDGVEEVSSRPLTFSFNGGPGSSSVWLHLGVLGPRRVLLDDEGMPLPPPARLVNNDYSLLDHTDMVFIDPIGTGFSRSVPGEKAEQFHTFNEDINSVGEFIRLYVTRYKRWNSPKFLIGESYGTTRAGGLAGYLQNRHGLYLNGIMLVSAVLNFQTIEMLPGNDLPFILYLPVFAATAWYHKQLHQDLQEDLQRTLSEAEALAMNEYTLALMKGDKLSASERDTIAAKLARYTGLSQDYIERSNLRIDIIRFCKELLRTQRRTVGRLDSRFLGMDRDGVGEAFEYDPSYNGIAGAYTSALNDYLRRDLNFETDLPYEILSEKVYTAWKYDKHQNQYVNVAETLRLAMTQNPFLKLFIANGYYDLATPYFATDYTVAHLGLDPSLHGNVSMAYYEAGHMMYIHLPSLKRLKDDLTHFILSATTR
ncbi:MAG: peptidase S10 [Chloroflexi bacterium]|nr:peptidase S10 [Chloroflexota bacterium]MBP8055241.1 peptidase S10 [Chloroflexota bacterium]